MEFLKSLGFDPFMLGVQILNFLIIFYLLKRFLYKPVLNMVKQRENKISEGLKQAEDAAKTLEKALEEEKRILTKAQSASQALIEDAKLEAKQLSVLMEEDARTKTQKIIAEAMLQIDQETREVEKRLSEKTGNLARDILTKSLSGVFTKDEQKEIIKKVEKNIKNVD